MTQNAFPFSLLMGACMTAVVGAVFLDLPTPEVRSSTAQNLPGAEAPRSLYASPHGSLHGHARNVSDVQPQQAVECEKSKAANGYRIEELFDQRNELRAATVRVNGVVTKVTTGIRGQTYFHLGDGSGSSDDRNNDLTVVTTGSVELGQLVEVVGQVVLDRDLGSGYRYDLLLESAEIVEQG